ncbi:hypothetical protein FXO38_11496 [Capsicum annuum]|uniref:Condensin complex subunit 2 n=1 Tax=Capsicum annuum TaxID=4072 RepID=A0A2G3AMY7_CAPAN|nr:hypothetical protein FXO37_25654 [Capsicum annuum]KAF3661783.1 hypothetical protein FXO38_11496 [Capsicum annuum]PHT95523.1 hypothetical protein T459_03405 [Capsicum annuum]
MVKEVHSLPNSLYCLCGEILVWCQNGVEWLERTHRVPSRLIDSAFAIDPLHHQTSAQFDEGGAKGLLLNNLRVYGDCHVLFDSFKIPGKSVPEATRDDGIISIDICCAKVLWLWNYMLVLGFFPLSAGRFFVCDPLSIDCFGPSLLASEPFTFPDAGDEDRSERVDDYLF